MRNLTLVRHCGLDPQSPKRKDSSSRLGDGGCDSAMTAIVVSEEFPSRSRVYFNPKIDAIKA